MNTFNPARFASASSISATAATSSAPLAPVQRQFRDALIPGCAPTGTRSCSATTSSGATTSPCATARRWRRRRRCGHLQLLGVGVAAVRPRRRPVLPAADRDVLEREPAVPRAGRHARQRRVARPGRHPLHEDVRRSRRRRRCTARWSSRVRGRRRGPSAARPDLCPDRRPIARHRHDRHRSGAVDGRVRHRRRSRRPVRTRAPRRERSSPTASRVEPALAYLKKHVGKIHWTAADATFRLTEDLLRRQLAHVLRGDRPDRRVQATTSAASRGSASSPSISRRPTSPKRS